MCVRGRRSGREGENQDESERHSQRQPTICRAEMGMEFVQGLEMDADRNALLNVLVVWLLP